MILVALTSSCLRVPRFLLLAVALATCSATTTYAAAPIRVLALGGSGGSHQPDAMIDLAATALAARDVQITFTEDIARLSRASLDEFDVLLIYKDDGELPTEQEADLLAWIDEGGGLLAVHCASHCFRNSTAYTRLVGGRFKEHGGETFRARIVDAQHPALRSVTAFESWDETYVHDQLTDDRRVLMVRPHRGGYEPYTWVRRQGEGRVFYTALGHDERTWRHPGFHRLLDQALRWLSGQAPDAPPRVAVDGAIPEPLGAEEAIERMHLPVGFRVELFAAEPDVQMPLAMAFDHRGRLWVLESFDYPNQIRDEGEGADRIKILEDTDGDGRADRTTIFAEGLNIPTGITFGAGGVIVANAPHVYLYRDLDGDDVADERRVLLSGFGRFDTHAVLNNLWYAPDNWIWGCVGYSGGSIQIGDRRQEFKMGLFRFRPDGSSFEFLTSTNNNTWGLGFTAEGDVLASTANRFHSWYMALPNRVFEQVRGWHAVGSRYNADHDRSHSISGPSRQWDHQGSFTSATNAAIYTADAFGPEYRDRAMFVCEPTIQVVHTNLLDRQGSDLIARDGYNLLASEDPWFAPTQAIVGPDGALWVLDFYSYSVLHNKPDEPKSDHGAGNAWLGNQHRDRERARVYRVVQDEISAEPAPTLSIDDPAGLVDALAHPNMFWRLAAQRLLVERASTDVAETLIERLTGTQNPHEQIHILRTLQGLGALDEPVCKIAAAVDRILQTAESGPRRTAVAVLPRTAASVDRIANAQLLSHADPFVRRDALQALGEMPSSEEVVPQLVALLREPSLAEDPWLPLAATAAAAASSHPFLSAMLTGSPEPSSDLSSSTVRIVAEHYARGAPGDRAGELLSLIDAAPPAIAVELLQGFEAGWSAERPALDEATWQMLAHRAEQTLPAVRLRWAALANKWGVGQHFDHLVHDLRQPLLAQLADETLRSQLRLEAARELLNLHVDEPTLVALLDTVSPRVDPEYVAELFTLCNAVEDESLGHLLVERWSTYTPAARQRALALLGRRSVWTKALLDGIDRDVIARNDVSVDRVQQLLSHPDEAIRARAQTVFERGGRLPSSDRRAVLDAWLPRVERSADPGLGKQVFEKNCAKCHRFGEIGEQVGPDLTGIGVRSRAELLTDVLDPNRSVEGNYRQYVVTTQSGLVLTGLLASESRTAIELLDSEARRHVVLREEIDELIASPNSVMPEGFEKLGEDELLGVLEFLSQQGRFVFLPVARAATSVSTRGMFYDHSHEAERLVFPQWGRVESQGVPFHVVDPRDERVPNAILLHSPLGDLTRQMPSSVELPCNLSARAIHILGGVAGWGFPLGQKGSLSMIVRLHYADGTTEDHPLLNGVHVADYIRQVDVPESEFAFALRNQQLRYLQLRPAQPTKIERIELIKGDDQTAPVVMAVTIERFEEP